jgi:hypothetical protein
VNVYRHKHRVDYTTLDYSILQYITPCLQASSYYKQIKAPDGPFCRKETHKQTVTIMQANLMYMSAECIATITVNCIA